MSKKISRSSDTDPSRSLALVLRDDGDVIVVVEKDGITIQDLRHEETPHTSGEALVEFSVSGTMSPRTTRTLQELFIAMREDEIERPHQ